MCQDKDTNLYETSQCRFPFPGSGNAARREVFSSKGILWSLALNENLIIMKARTSAESWNITLYLFSRGFYVTIGLEMICSQVQRIISNAETGVNCMVK